LSSYFFYSCWDWRFVFLLLFSTLLDYYAGLKIAASTNQMNKKIWLWASVCINVGFLAFFKYFNFFIESFTDLLLLFGIHTNIWMLNIILPIGISFYTFHGLSYIIDIYYNRINPEKSFVTYALFVSFFPLLVAGPIERATHLLPQIKQSRIFNSIYATDGLRQMLWGFFKKLVIADNCGLLVDNIFKNYESLPGSTIFLGGLLFYFQIYCDFSGYSDIAIGVARLFGIQLMQNFRFPLFATSFEDNWRRWHISLSSWLRDYIYIPLGGGRNGLFLKIRNILIVFFISGLWHGPKWTFIIWGILNAVLLIIETLMKQSKSIVMPTHIKRKALIPDFRALIQMVTVFMVVGSTYFFFRSDSLAQSISMYKTIFSKTFFAIPRGAGLSNWIYITLITFFVIIEWVGKDNKHALETLFDSYAKPIRWSFYSFIIFLIALYGIGDGIKFIYFQF
jgi:D-alanyl-lipoteichoic acid acyltransferase DltB (MBOAT superfamily)